MKRMKLKIKKIIAREFLYLLFTSILFFVFFFLMLWRSEVLNNKIRVVDEEITSLTDPEILPSRLKLFYYLENYRFKRHENDPVKFIQDMENKDLVFSIYGQITNENKIIYSRDQFYNKLKKDTISGSYINKITPLEHRKRELMTSMFYGYGSSSDVELAIVVFVCFFYLLRYLIYATIWSIKQLREKS